MNRRVRSIMRKPKYGPNGSMAWSVGLHWIDEWQYVIAMGQSNMTGRPARKQLLHKGKKP